MAVFGLLATNVDAGQIAYFYALDADLTDLQSAGNSVGAPKLIGGQKVTTVQVGANTVRAVKMGSGCTQTAVTAATTLSCFSCDLAISTGSAGRLVDELKIGEWVRVAEVVSYQHGSETAAGFILGQNAVQKLGGKMPGAIPESLATCQSIRIASGEIFLSSNGFREQLRATTQAQCVDMNLAGLAVACSQVGVPLLAWKVISDSANDSASADFQAFVKAYDGEGGRRVAELIRTLHPDPNDPGAHSNLKALLESAPKSSPK